MGRGLPEVEAACSRSLRPGAGATIGLPRMGALTALGPSAGLSEQTQAGAGMLQWLVGSRGEDMPEEVPLGPESAHHLPRGCREGTVESHWQGL